MYPLLYDLTTCQLWHYNWRFRWPVKHTERNGVSYTWCILLVRAVIRINNCPDGRIAIDGQQPGVAWDRTGANRDHLLRNGIIHPDAFVAILPEEEARTSQIGRAHV